jgi:uncharacterized protein
VSLRWLNEPWEWSGDASALTVHASPGTDFWRTTHYGFVRDSGHLAWLPLAGDGRVSLRFGGDFAAQYDQAGLMLRVDAETWIKAGIERAEGRDWLSVVVTRGVSDWSRQPAPPPDEHGYWELIARRTGDAVDLSCAGEPIRLAPLAPDVPVMAGAMCAAPDGPGFPARFQDLRVHKGV